MEACVSLALSSGMGPRVAAAHVNAAAYYPEPYFQKVLEEVRRSEISIVACPLINSAMQGRYDPWPKGRGLTRIKEFHEAGVNVALAHDDIRSPFYPLETGNPLEAAHMAAHLAHMTGQSEMQRLIGMLTAGGAQALGLGAAYGMDGGSAGDGPPPGARILAAVRSGGRLRPDPDPPASAIRDR